MGNFGGKKQGSMKGGAFGKRLRTEKIMLFPLCGFVFGEGVG